MSIFSEIHDKLHQVETDVAKALKSVEKVAVHLGTDTALQGVVEAVSGAAFGSSAVSVEKAVFSLADGVGTALEANEQATTAHLTSIGLDLAGIQAFKDVWMQAKKLKTVL